MRAFVAWCVGALVYPATFVIGFRRIDLMHLGIWSIFGGACSILYLSVAVLLGWLPHLRPVSPAWLGSRKGVRVATAVVFAGLGLWAYTVFTCEMIYDYDSGPGAFGSYAFGSPRLILNETAYRIGIFLLVFGLANWPLPPPVPPRVTASVP